jgi:HSP20 family protein
MEMTGPNFATLGTNLPSVNLKETDKKKISSSWSKKEDFKIELDNKMLTISSEKEQEKRRKGIRELLSQESYQSFSRSFNLPDYTDENQIDANYKDGILHVAIAKKKKR